MTRLKKLINSFTYKYLLLIVVGLIAASTVSTHVWYVIPNGFITDIAFLLVVCVQMWAATSLYAGDKP